MTCNTCGHDGCSDRVACPRTAISNAVHAALRTDWSDPACNPSDAEIDALADEFDDECGRIKSDRGIDFARAVLALRPAAPRAQEPDGRLLDLLARIHGDGGHYVQEHGIEKAAEHADKLVAEWRAQICAAPRAQEPTRVEGGRVVANYDETRGYMVGAPKPAAAPTVAAVLAEREACAKLCDSYAKHLRAFAYDAMAAAAESCAESIRARTEGGAA